MYQIEFYETAAGKSEAYVYIAELEKRARTSKTDRVRFNKIVEYMRILESYGTYAGLPYMRHMGDGLWELRPLNDRFFFVHWVKDRFVILHHFTKKDQKTPKKELEQARRNLKDYRERSGDNG